MADENIKEGEDAVTEETQAQEAEGADVGQDAQDVQEEEVIVEPVKPVADAPILAPVVAPATAAPALQTPVKPGRAPKKNDDGSVTLSAEAFAGVMERLAKLENDSSLLTQVQDRNTIAKIERLRAEGKLVKSVKVRKVGEKFVVGWQLLQDEVYTNEEGRLVEKQLVKIFFHDGSDKTYSMKQFASLGEYIPFEVTGEERDAEGNLFLKTVGADGLVLQLNVKFIN